MLAIMHALFDKHFVTVNTLLFLTEEQLSHKKIIVIQKQFSLIFIGSYKSEEDI